MPQVAINAVFPSRAAPLRLLPAYRTPAAVDGPATIRSERVSTPVLCVAGAEDALWPSADMARAILARRKRVDDELLVLPQAGHLLGLPHRPATALGTGGIAFGGTPEGVARGQVQLQHRLLAFLAQTVGDARPGSGAVPSARFPGAPPDRRPEGPAVGRHAPPTRGTAP